MLKLICCENGSLSHATGSTTSGGTFTITTPASLFTKTEGYGIYKGTITFSFTGGSSTETLGGTGTITPGTVAGSGSITGTAVYVKDDNEVVILEGDEGAFTVLTGTFIPTAPPNTPVPSTTLPNTNVVFDNAGQTTVNAE